MTKKVILTLKVLKLNQKSSNFIMRCTFLNWCDESMMDYEHR